MLVERAVEWTEKWKQEGLQQGELAIPARQPTRRFGPFDAETLSRLEQAHVQRCNCTPFVQNDGPVRIARSAPQFMACDSLMLLRLAPQSSG